MGFENAASRPQTVSGLDPCSCVACRRASWRKMTQERMMRTSASWTRRRPSSAWTPRPLPAAQRAPFMPPATGPQQHPPMQLRLVARQVNPHPCGTPMRYTDSPPHIFLLTTYPLLATVIAAPLRACKEVHCVQPPLQQRRSAVQFTTWRQRMLMSLMKS